MKYKLVILAALLTTLIGCSAPRGHHNYRNGGIKAHQQNKKVDHQSYTKEDWNRRRSNKREKNNERNLAQ